MDSGPAWTPSRTGSSSRISTPRAGCPGRSGRRTPSRGRLRAERPREIEDDAAVVVEDGRVAPRERLEQVRAPGAEVPHGLARDHQVLRAGLAQVLDPR